MKGLIRKGKKFAYQAGIPADVRSHFGDRKKFQRVFATNDLIEAERLAAEADREFRAMVLQFRQNALNGERIDPQRRDQIVGWIFGHYFGQLEDDRGPDLRERVDAILAEAREEGFPLTRGLHSEGLVFDQIVQSVETLLEWAEGTGYARKRPAERPGSTLIGAYEEWKKRAQQQPKTILMYGKEVRRFTEWFELSNGKCQGARITQRHVNDFVSGLMRRHVAKSTINGALSALRMIYKAGQFGPSNPFSRVHDRMIVEGDRLEVRGFTDAEMQQLLRPGPDRAAVLIAAYSGLRLSEITALRRSNIEKVGRTWVFNLVTAGRRKTKAGYRKVPVHPVLFREIVKPILKNDLEQPLVPGWNTGTLSKRINRLIDTVTDDPAVRAHSFRHTFLTKLAEAGCRKELRMAIAGHEGSDVADRYTHADFLIELAQQIGKVRYG
jgi:integrase